MKTLKQYLEEKGIKNFDEMSADEKAVIFNKLNEENATAFKALKESGEATKVELSESITKMAEAHKEQVDLLNETLKEQGLAIKKVQDISKGDISLTNSQSIEKSLRDEEAKLKDMSESGQGKVVLKVVGDMTISGNVSHGNVPVEQRLPGLSRIARRRTFIRSLINNGVATSNVISWVDQANVDGAVGGTKEGKLKHQIDFDLVVMNESLKKRTGFIKVSTEMLGDIDFMRSEIDNELMQLLALDIDDQILNGSNLGQNLNGIMTQASPFVAGAFALNVVAPNLIDVLTIAANQIEVANHMATAHIVHPTDLTALRLIKAGASDGRYVSRLQDVAGTLMLDGIPVVANTGMAIDNFLTMDGGKATVYSKGETTIQVGLDSDDFTKNMRTVLAEWRGLNIIKTNNKTAFVKGVVSASITAITKP